MECHCISPDELQGITPLYSAFLSDFARVANFYRHPPTAKGIEAASREVRLEDAVRRAVVDGCLVITLQKAGPNRG